jgi:uncharacterized membrane protein
MMTDGMARRIVVLSDGNETDGDAQAAAESAAASGTTVDFVRPDDEVRADAVVTGVDVPDEIRENAPFDLRVAIESHGISRGVLFVDRDGTTTLRTPVNLNDGLNTIRVPQRVESRGISKYRVTFESESDRQGINNVGAAFAEIKGRPKALIIQDRPNDLLLAKALEKQGIESEVVPPSRIPVRPEQLQAYELIVLNDTNAVGVSPAVQKQLVSSARDTGIGLAMIGGENSFLPGGWYGSAVAEALPVDLNIRQKKSVAAASVLIIADCSGSMSMVEDGLPKVRLAAKAAEETINMLGPMDRVGVAGSSDGIDVLVPMMSAADKTRAIDRARRLAVNGSGIYIRPSVAKANEILSRETSKVRHFIILADGNDSTDWDTALETATSMRLRKISTSVVAIGDGNDVPMLKRLAAVGGGRFYLAKKAAELPAIFTQDTATMSRSAIEDGAFIPKLSRLDPSVMGVFDAGSPALYAYCLVEPRPLSKVILKTAKDDPLYVTGRHGLATTFAFMSDSQSRWARDWVAWDRFGQFWAQVVRAGVRQTTKNRYRVATRATGGKVRINVKGLDKSGVPLNVPETPIRIARPDGSSQQLVLTQIAPGEFEGEIDAALAGSYIVSVVESDGHGGSRVQTTGLSVSYPAEYRAIRPNLPLLTSLAETGQGRAIETASEAFRKAAQPGSGIQELWYWFLLAALLALPADIAVRRIVGQLWREFVPARARLPQKVEKNVETLKAAKERAEQKRRETAAKAVTPAAPVTPPRPLIAEPTIDPEDAEDEPAAQTPASVGSALLRSKRERRGTGTDDP